MARSEINKLFDQKGDIVKKMEEIGREVRDGKRATLTDEQRTQLHAYNDKLKELDKQIEDQELLIQIEANKAVRDGVNITNKEIEGRSQEDKDEEKRNFNFDFQIYKKPEVRFGPITEHRLRNYDVNEKMQRADVYQVLAAMHPMADHNTFSAATKYALGECRGATATAMLTEFLSAQLLDGGLSKSRLAEAGMQVQTMEEPTKRFAKITTYPSFEWKAAQDQTTDRTVVFDSVDFEAKTIRGFLTISGEQAQDCHNLDSALRTVFRRSIGNSIDYAGLWGAGSATEPEGIYNYTSVNRYDFNALLDSYNPYSEVAKLILDDNGELPDTSIISPGVWKVQAQFTQGGTDAPMPQQWWMAVQNTTSRTVSHRFLETTQVTDELDEQPFKTAIFTGGFRSVNLGVRLQTQVMISPIESDRFRFNYLTVFRGDIKPYREEDLGVIDNVWTSDNT